MNYDFEKISEVTKEIENLHQNIKNLDQIYKEPVETTEKERITPLKQPIDLEILKVTTINLNIKISAITKIPQ